MTRWGRRLRRCVVWGGVLLLGGLLGERVASWAAPFPIDRIASLAVSKQVFARDGTLLRVCRTPADERVLPVPLEAISPYVVDALLCAEDERFYSHSGVDFLAVGRAALANLGSGSVVSGASTLTMQVVRIVLAERSRSIAFKLVQAFRARQLERELTKPQILELYCNHVPLGGAVCGFEAAARRWFGKAGRDLRPAEAATLVAMLPAPSFRSPRRRPELLRRLRDRLLTRMHARGALTAGELEAAVGSPLGAQRRPWPALAPHACDYFTRSARGQQIRTHLDLDLQRRVESVAVAQHTGCADGTAIVVLDRADARIAAMLGAVDPTRTALNTATCRRSLGSTLKPFLYALAVETGALVEDARLADVPRQFGDYRPANFSRDYVGAIRMAPALAASRNLPAIELLAAVGVDRFGQLLRQLGLETGSRPLHLDAALGTLAASPLALARAYCRFVGNDRAPGLRPRTVRRVLDALSRFPIGAAAGCGSVAFKTGTSSGRRDAWCVGITPDHVVVVWAGNLSGRGEPGLVGSHTALRLMTRVVGVL